MQVEVVEDPGKILQVFQLQEEQEDQAEGEQVLIQVLMQEQQEQLTQVVVAEVGVEIIHQEILEQAEPAVRESLS
jgi:hypothetical protein